MARSRFLPYPIDKKRVIRKIVPLKTLAESLPAIGLRERRRRTGVGWGLGDWIRVTGLSGCLL